MFFSGRLPTPPWETRARVESLVKQYDRAYIPNTGDRFRFSTLQSRFATFIDLWDRGLRAREEGRPGPFMHQRAGQEPERKGPEDVLGCVLRFRARVRETDKRGELSEPRAEARREGGEAPPPFHKFADLVKNQVKQLRQKGSPEVAFRVAVKDGKV